MRKFLLSISLLFLAVVMASAQTVRNVQAVAERNIVTITYDLIAAGENEKFDIELRSSIDGFNTTLKEVSGDVGPDQVEGIGKTITWLALKEQGKYSGSVSFEITAILTFAPLSVTSPVAGSSAKLGKSLDVQWRGGDRDRNLKMAILQGNATITEVPDVGNAGKYSWTVPKSLAKGDNYQIKLFDPTKPNDSAMSAEFQLKKTSILVYIIPAAVLIGVGVAVLVGGGGGEEPPTGGGGGGSVDCAATPTHPDCVITPSTDLPAPPPFTPGGGI